jgi:2-polyprenyl-3-methyl-5-hydroxy-6-metoxy-1,4-benzoquinol methylase
LRQNKKNRRNIKGKIMDGFGGERQIGKVFEEIEPKHIERYNFANKFVSKGDVVLDAACGIGYGSTILAENAKSVLSLDNSEEALEYCRTHWGAENITYDVIDLESDFQNNVNGKFDVIVSLETLEHLENPLIETCMKFYELLELGGHLIVSHPHMQKTPKSLKGEHHKHWEIDGELLSSQLIENGFDVVEEWYQSGRKAHSNPYHLLSLKKIKL